MKKILLSVRHFLSQTFNLDEDKADEQLIIESIRKDVHFRGTNLWTLIFAIFIASIGLNVNSTAVIIGAMLISPLMGPIMGIGLGIGINDFDLVKKGIKNLFIAALFSVAASSLYFAITPLHDASSELLARTNPSIWDVFIAFFGGLAGVVAGTRKHKSNVIPGVAIATALMPPLCTAGFGLATGKWFYLLGAIYLFFINSLFICLATFLIVKKLRFHKVEFSSPEREKRVSRYILILVVLTVLPSIYLAYRIVQRSIFENNAQKFVQNEFHFPRTQVVTHKFIFDGTQQKIELLLVGVPLSESMIDSMKNKMPAYDLNTTKLVVHQGLDAKQKIDLSEIKASVMEEIFATEHRDDTFKLNTETQNISDTSIKDELKALFPQIKQYSVATAKIIRLDTTSNSTITYFIGTFRKPVTKQDRIKLGSWLKLRLGVDTVHVIVR